MIELLKDLALPSNITALGMILGTVLVSFERSRRIGLRIIITACVVLIVFSSGVVAALLLRPLEYQYPYIQRAAQYPEVKSIVVLTSYAADDPLVPGSSKVDGHTAFRILEAQRLLRECPACNIVISGGGAAPQIVKEILVASGVDASAIVLDSGSRHTDASASNLEGLLGQRQFFLVTSAGHMARATGVFKRRGMKPVPAPTDYLMPRNVFSASLQARIQHMHFADLAVREYAGIAWYKIRGMM